MNIHQIKKFQHLFSDYNLPEQVQLIIFDKSLAISDRVIKKLYDSKDPPKIISELVQVGVYGGFLCGYLSAKNSTLDHIRQLPPLSGDEEDADTTLEAVNDFFSHAYQSYDEAEQE